MITDPNKRLPIKAAARKSTSPINLKLPATADLFINTSTTRERIDHRQIIKLLGVKAVLLRIKNGTKGPERSGWQKTTFDQTCLPKYQRSLELAETIGVLLGTPSEGLCSIDFDDDAALKEFLIANPNLENSLRTKGLRGANIWIVVEGEIPRSRKLTSNGLPIGEWRANRAHTIIAGKHPEGVHYSIIVNAAPIRIRYSDIVWPWSCSSPLSLPLPPPSSELSVSSVSLHNKAQRGMNADGLTPKNRTLDK